MKVNSLYPIIVSENPEKEIQFYQMLGFEKKHDVVTELGSHVYVLSNGDLEMEIMEQVINGPLDMPVGAYGMRMNVPDIEEAYQELQEKGYTVMCPPIETKTGNRNLFVKDADGVNITLVQHIKK